MSADSISFVIGIIVLALLASAPIILLVFGLQRIKSSSGKIQVGAGVAILLAYLSVIVGYVTLVGPGRSGILAQGMSPQGLEYCVVQTYKNMAEPYQVSFYIRDASGLWRWNYLAHQDSVWHSATVDFSNGVARVSRDGVFYKDIPLPTNSVDLTAVLPGYQSEYCPSNFSVEDVFKYHCEKFK